MKAIFLRTFPHIGHGAGPSVNKRSMQDSHLACTRDRISSRVTESRKLDEDSHAMVACRHEKTEFGVEKTITFADWTDIVFFLCQAPRNKEQYQSKYERQSPVSEILRGIRLSFQLGPSRLSDNCKKARWPLA